MRPTITTAPSITTLGTVVALASFATACMGEIGSGERKGRSTDPTKPTADAACTKIERDVTIRSMADMGSLPKSGCYDIYGKLTLQGSSITTLLGLNEINSVNELDLDHTGLVKLDTKRPLGIYGSLTAIGNTKLTNLKGLSFEIPAKGILIDGNTVLTSVDPLGIEEPKLEEVDGDISITGNPALTAIPLKNLAKVTGGVTISSNAGIRSVDLSKLANTGHIELADNAQLSSVTGFSASTINGDFAVRDNPVLSTLGTMATLYRVTGNVTIDNNAALPNLAAFTTSVKFVDKALTIRNNQSLVDLGQLKRLQLIGAITITNNRNLVACRAVEIDRCTQHPTTSVISNNGTTNCNWQCN
jgi:hypothetical protein